MKYLIPNDSGKAEHNSDVLTEFLTEAQKRDLLNFPLFKTPVKAA